MVMQVLRLANASEGTSKRNAMIGEVVGYRLKKLQAISGEDKVRSPPIHFSSLARSRIPPIPIPDRAALRPLQISRAATAF
jgi:hypothetical protein